MAAELLSISADTPHFPRNPGPGPATAVISRTDPNEQESVILMPELKALVPAQSRPRGCTGDAASTPPAPYRATHAKGRQSAEARQVQA